MTTQSTAVEGQANPAVPPKKIVERSAAYPDISVEDAVTFTADVAKHFPGGSQIINREDIGAVLNKVAGSVKRDVASCAHYGFLLRVDGGYQISPTYKTIANPLSARERRKFLLQAFGEPKLNKELIDKFDGHAVPSELRTHLIRFHKIAENASDHAAEVFIKSAKECQVLNDKNILNYKQELLKLSDTGIQYAEVTTEKPKEQQVKEEVGNVVTVLPREEKPLELPTSDTVTEEKLKIPLSDRKFAILTYPSNITKKDTDILMKQIELLQILVT
jgi:hypothetical protein